MGRTALPTLGSRVAASEDAYTISGANAAAIFFSQKSDRPSRSVSCCSSLVQINNVTELAIQIPALSGFGSVSPVQNPWSHSGVTVDASKSYPPGDGVGAVGAAPSEVHELMQSRADKA